LRFFNRQPAMHGQWTKMSLGLPMLWPLRHQDTKDFDYFALFFVSLCLRGNGFGYRNRRSQRRDRRGFEPRSHFCNWVICFSKSANETTSLPCRSQPKNLNFGNYPSEWSRSRLRVGNSGLNLGAKARPGLEFSWLFPSILYPTGSLSVGLSHRGCQDRERDRNEVLQVGFGNPM